MTDGSSPYRPCRRCGFAVVRRCTFCRDCGLVFPATPFPVVLVAAVGLSVGPSAAAGLFCRWLVGLAERAGPRVPEVAAALTGAGFLALALGCLSLLASEAGGGGERSLPTAGGGALLGLALGSMSGKALLAGSDVIPLAGAALGVALSSAVLLRAARRRRPSPILVERERRLRASLDVVDAAGRELAAARALLSACGGTEANQRASAALARAEAARKEERARLGGALLRIALLRWGSRLKALSAGFGSLTAAACRTRRTALAELADEGKRFGDARPGEPASSEEAELLDAALGACRKLDEALLVREVMLLARPSDGLEEEAPALLLPDVDALFATALDGLEAGERSASAKRRAEEEVAALVQPRSRPDAPAPSEN